MRDPRVDPMPGDQVRSSHTTRTVLRVVNDKVLYEDEVGQAVDTLEQWVRWCHMSEAEALL
jgi:hypothetical protein